MLNVTGLKKHFPIKKGILAHTVGHVYAVDGVSLTLVDVEAERFSVALIPHTLRITTLGKLAVGDAVNLETDLLAKYVERQLVLSGQAAAPAAEPNAQP